MRGSFVNTMLVLLISVSANMAAEFQPRFQEATLRSDAGELPRLRVWPEWRELHWSNERAFLVDNDGVVEVCPSDQSDLRRVVSPDGKPLRWLAAAGGVAYLAVERTKEEVQAGELYLKPEVRRLDLDKMDWLPSLLVSPSNANEVPEPKSPDQEPPDGFYGPHHRAAYLGTVLGGSRGVAILSYTLNVHEHKKRRWPKWYRTLTYEVTCFEPSANRRWTKSFPWLGEVDVPSCMMAAEHTWGGDRCNLEPLSWLGEPEIQEGVLVCAGQKQDLVCLDLETGGDLWRVARIWEFDRGYIGPSVFEHYLSRFGVDPWVVDAAEGETDPAEFDPEHLDTWKEDIARYEETKKAFYALYQSRIVAGPVVVPEEDAWRGQRVFVAVTRARQEEWTSETAEGIVYELGDQGEFESITRLPRPVVGWPYKTFPGGLLWSCDRGCLVRLGPYQMDFSRGFVMSGNDLLTRIAWYREIHMHVTPAWFWADPPYAIACFSEDRMFRASASYVAKPEETVYRFLISVVDLRTGLDHDLTLAVPFEGDFPMPETGYGRFGDRVHALHPHLLEISGLECKEGVLRVIMKTNRGQIALDFDLK